MPQEPTTTSYLEPWVDRGFYAFICHAERDKPRIRDLRLVPQVTRYGVRIVIDRDKPAIEVENPSTVHTFRGGREWRSEMEAYVSNARCVLILWSENMEKRILEESDGGCIGQEIVTGLRNGTAFFSWLDTKAPSPEPICAALEGRVPGFKAEYRALIESKHILPLVRETAGEPDLRHLEADMRDLAKYLDEMITALPSLRQQLDDDDPRLNKLLNLIDREQAVTRIVDKGALHVVTGREQACRVQDLIQRLKEIELPPSHRSRGADWRAKFVRGDFDPDPPWVHRQFKWPVAAAPPAGTEAFQAAVRSARDRLYENIAATLEFAWDEASPDTFREALNAYLERSADAFLLSSDIRCEPATAARDVALVAALRTIIDGLPCRHKVRIMLNVLEAPSRWSFIPFRKKSPSHPLIEASARLEDLRVDDLINWAALTEQVVGRPSNRIMDAVDRIYVTRAERALSMLQVRELLARDVLAWLAAAPASAKAPRRGADGGAH